MSSVLRCDFCHIPHCLRQLHTVDEQIVCAWIIGCTSAHKVVSPKQPSGPLNSALHLIPPAYHVTATSLSDRQVVSQLISCWELHELYMR